MINQDREREKWMLGFQVVNTGVYLCRDGAVGRWEWERKDNFFKCMNTVTLIY